MNELDDLMGAETSPVSLSDIVGEPLPTITLPKAAMRNRAATTALLSEDPSKAVDNYQMFMAEGEQGSSSMIKAEQNRVQAQLEQQDKSSFMSVLSDPNIDIGRKRQLIENMKLNPVLRDTGTSLLTNSAMKPSEGETPEAEKARVGSVSDWINEIYQTNEQVQGLVNAHGAKLRSADLSVAVEAGELWFVPFANNLAVNKMINQDKSFWGVIKALTLPGSTTLDVRSQLERMPPSERVKFTESLLKQISDNSSFLLSNDNQFAQYEKAKNIFQDGGYSSTDAFLDNVASLLDIVSLGWTLRGAKTAKQAVQTTAPVPPTGTIPKAPAEETIRFNNWEVVDDTPRNPFAARIGEPKKQIEFQDRVKRIEVNSPVHTPNPVSPIEIAHQSNPSTARSMHEAIVSSADDAVAEGLAGNARQQAIVDNVFPQAITDSGAVTARTVDIDRNLRNAMNVPERVIQEVWNRGFTEFSPQEKAQALANVQRDFQQAEGMVMNEAMGGFGVNGGRINISAVYGTPEGAFLNAKEAYDQALYALRGKGIRPEEVTILQKQGTDYKPVKLEDVGDAEGSFLVKIDTNHEISAADIVQFEGTTVRLNWLDRMPGANFMNQGSFARHLFDAASMLDPRITGAASNVSDMAARFEKMLLEQATEFSDVYEKLDKSQRGLVESYFKEANLKRLPMDLVDLANRGLSPEAIESVQKWRSYWDTHFYLENLDLVRTLNAEGYQMFKNKHAEVFAKPMAKNRTINTVYDPATDAVVPIRPDEIDDLYTMNGTLAKLRRPTNFGGTTAEYMIVRNTPNEYLRRVRDTDQVLNYVEGYYTISYKAPRFVDEIASDGTRKAIAVAGDTAEAERFAQRMRQAAANGQTYKVRADDRALRVGSDDWFDTEQARGRIAQRHRGKTLEDGSGMNHLGDGSYIQDPVTSAVKAARSISGRTVARPMLEAAKARWLANRGQYAPSNGMGGKRFPTDRNEIGAKGENVTSDVADARTEWEYINYLENGYINGVDAIFKQLMLSMADKAGSYGLSKLERAALAGTQTGPAQAGKQAVFMAYIGTNPLRQLFLQPHQAFRTIGYNPQAWYTGKLFSLGSAYFAEKAAQGITKTFKGVGVTPLTHQQSIDFIKFVDDSGMIAAVDKQNLVRGTLADAADHGNRIVKGAATAVNIPRKLGFDAGESINNVMHLAAVYDRYERMGKNLKDLAVRDEAFAEARALSYEMNFAGDMPYNQNFMSLVLQFMQVPHKAMLQLTNRKLDFGTRARLLGTDLLFWGPPTWAVSEFLGGDILPDDPKLREIFLHGMESFLLNESMRELFKDDSINVDYSSLAPYDMTGWGKFFEGMMSDGLSGVWSNSPAGQLLKEGGRVQNAIQSMMRFVGFEDPIEETPETFLQVANEILSISSGWSNGMKAYQALEAQKRFNKYGKEIDSNTHSFEAYLQALGFGSAEQRDIIKAGQFVSKVTKEYKDEITKDVNVLIEYVSKNLETKERDVELIQRVTARVLSKYNGNPEAMKIARDVILMRVRDPSGNLMYNMMKASGLTTRDELKDAIRIAPISEDQKQLMLQRIDDLNTLDKTKVK